VSEELGEAALTVFEELGEAALTVLEKGQKARKEYFRYEQVQKAVDIPLLKLD